MSFCLARSKKPPQVSDFLGKSFDSVAQFAGHGAEYNTRLKVIYSSAKFRALFMTYLLGIYDLEIFESTILA